MAVIVATEPQAEVETIDGHDAVRLVAGDLEATFLPGLGMLGASLRHAGEELLDLRDGLDAYRETGAVLGIPLLHPWANRLDGDRYELHGRPVHLPGGPPVHREERGLPIHGLLAAHPGWRIDALDHGPGGSWLRASLAFGADPALLAAFPFHHTLTFQARLTPSALTVATRVEATGGAPVPVATGFHPYLRLPGADRTRWRLTFPPRRHVALDERGIPTGRAVRRSAVRFWLGDRAFDDAYDEIADGARFTVSAAGREIAVKHQQGFPVAQVYSPPGAQYVCFEPMAAPVNALRSGAGLRRAVPGRPDEAVFSIAVRAT